MVVPLVICISTEEGGSSRRTVWNKHFVCQRRLYYLQTLATPSPIQSRTNQPIIYPPAPSLSQEPTTNQTTKRITNQPTKHPSTHLFSHLGERPGKIHGNPTLTPPSLSVKWGGVDCCCPDFFYVFKSLLVLLLLLFCSSNHSIIYIFPLSLSRHINLFFYLSHSPFLSRSC